ncbi:MAG TPA: hypothetical protein VGQ70_03455 [Candidatus Udaeobacter sp.]|nr:hypothetical protein [Candidatus Udaeobacter sp.]
MAATSLFAANRAEPLTGKELEEFLGPVSPHVFRWTKLTAIDFELYNGEAKPPLSGHVGFYVGGHPNFKPNPRGTKLKGRIGIFPVIWYRSIDKDALISQQTLVRLDNYWQVDLMISTKRQEDIERLIATIGHLPLFAKKPRFVFGSEHDSAHPW